MRKNGLKRFSFFAISIFFGIICVFSFVLPCAGKNLMDSPVLKFKNGKFKIVQFTDLHWWVDDSNYQREDSTYQLMKYIVEKECPDLVILTGDVVTSNRAIEGWKKITQLFVDEKVPFAVTFGNHDSETDMDNAQILDFLKTVPYNLTYDAESGKSSGSGNCALPIMASDGKAEKWVLYLFDSHNMTKEPAFGYYDWIHQDQIEWYRKTSNDFTALNGRKLPSLAFFHIPFPEYDKVLSLYSHIGTKGESVCSPDMDSGLFSSFIEQKDVIGVFVGHDHNNDYLVDYDGYIALAYGRKTGYNPAYTEILKRGARIINLHEDEASFNTYIRDMDGVHDSYMFEQKNKGKDYPQLNGSFIQHHLVARWNDARWDKEIAMLKEAGMKYLIYAPALEVNEKGVCSADYPTSLASKGRQDNTIEKCLKSARKYGLKVFLGLNFNERWWKADYDGNWLVNQMKIGNKVADELVALYKKKYEDTMYGWYWAWEVSNTPMLTKENMKILAQAININLDHLSEITPDMPFMMSPYMNEKMGNSTDNAKMWTNIFASVHFRDGDIFAPQDCVGAGGLTIDHLGDWFSKLKGAVNSKPGLKFWSNVETFDQKFWVSASLTRIQRQMDIADTYVSNFICFAYSHYDSPYIVCKDYHTAYLKYCKDGKFPSIAVPQPVSNVFVRRTSRGVEIKWTVNDLNDVAGFNIYRNGKLLMRLGEKNNVYPDTYLDKKSGNITDRYEISTYNVLGSESSKIQSKE